MRRKGATKDPVVTTDDIFGDLHPQGQQTNITSLEAVDEEGDQKQITVEEVSADRVQEREAQVEDSLPEEHPTIPVAAGSPSVLHVSLTQRTCSHLAIKLGCCLPGLLNCRWELWPRII